MKFGSKLQFECPDDCPISCIYKWESFSQGCTCTRCPIFCCKGSKGDGMDFPPLIDPEGYRDDWAEEWEEFFKTGREPLLRLDK